MAKKTTFDIVNITIWFILIIIICIGLLLLYNKTVFEKFEDEKKVVDEPKKEEKKEDESLDKTEQSIFDKIVRNEVSSTDLQKLINAGVVTQNMVEKFLSKLDSKEETKIEAFCSVGDPGCPL
jgi:regulator of PEP synthase PpsR (kinase-PPPase family)